MARENVLVIRMDATERELSAIVATRLGRTESALHRQLVAEKAKRLGIVPTERKEGAHAT